MRNDSQGVNSGDSDVRLLEYIDEVHESRTTEGSLVREVHRQDHDFQRRCDTVDKVIHGQMCNLTRMLAIAQMEARGLRNLKEVEDAEPGSPAFADAARYRQRALEQIETAQRLKEEMGTDYVDTAGGTLD